MLAARLENSGDGWQQYQLVVGPDVASYRDVVACWISDPSFQDSFSDWLAESEYAAFFLEIRPVKRQDLDEAFEFVIANSPALARRFATPDTFSQWYEPDRPVVTFPNLGSDAMLVAPCPDSNNPQVNCAHLASFLRTAPKHQVRSLWREVGNQVFALVDQSPLWVSTSGLGVAWLHVRLDRTPKYYTHLPYTLL